ncbi:MAG: hypothetical protein ONB48_13585 [candidate division KSB1 bacterium]|nr:hypothetical protein [candidate division KSB1 bacterium]MDZ7274867.1 hypothetical protein [candidate division KSB1 bacterium]MDZ7286681.1 hypothetical protein [candidate division KSB1 bacterium]MDZ7299156.1 hypothetical protein [candidate division KSB1 bacterium]MDZ7307034.1 hypothetical protein [candidate division KSB1 bacterium]
MAKSGSRLALPIGCLLLLTSLGCYTVIKHPRLAGSAEAAGGDPSVAVTLGEDCHACHAAGFSGFHGIAVPPPRPAPSWRWQYYYDTPWWQSYYAPAAAGSGDEAEVSKRPFDRRRQATPEEPAPAGHTPAAQPLPPTTVGAVARPSGRDSATTVSKPKEDSAKRRARRGTVPPNN